MNVKKRNGILEKLCVDKINSVVIWACEGLDANPSDIIMNANIQLFDGIKTTKIHEILINSSIDLISINNPDYQYVASRLCSFYMRKQIFGVFKDEEMPSVKYVVEQNVKNGLYDKEILTKFDDDMWSKINDIVDHSNDSKLTIASYQKMLATYLVKNRHSGYVYETPQYSFIVIAATLFDTLKEIKEFYKELTSKSLNIPTPIMAGVRTGTRQFASCCLIDVGDDLDSIYSSNHAIGRFVSRRAGIGLNMGRIRSHGSSIRKGEATHTGIIPFLKLAEAATKSCSQGGLRDGSTTVHFQIWNREIEEILVLKNNKGTDDNRVRRLDYSIQVTKLFWERMVKGENISLFSTSDTPGLYEAFGLPEFNDLYLKYENNKNISRKVVNGKDILLSLSVERMNTGRIYIQNLDNANAQSPFKDKISMSNLCLDGDSLVDIIVVDIEEIELISKYNLEKIDNFYQGKISMESIDELFNNLYIKSYKIENNIVLNSKGSLKVKCKNIETDEVEYSQVFGSKLMNEYAEVIKITDQESGKYIICTEDHLIFTKNRGYIKAMELLEDDVLDIN